MIPKSSISMYTERNCARTDLGRDFFFKKLHISSLSNSTAKSGRVSSNNTKVFMTACIQNYFITLFRLYMHCRYLFLRPGYKFKAIPGETKFKLYNSVES